MRPVGAVIDVQTGELKIAQAPDVLAAIALGSCIAIGIYVSSIRAGGMGGAQTLARLQKIDPRVVAIVSSGYADNPAISRFHEYGFKAAVTKPYLFNELRLAIQTALADTDSTADITTENKDS